MGMRQILISITITPDITCGLPPRYKRAKAGGREAMEAIFHPRERERSGGTRGKEREEERTVQSPH